MTIRLYLDEDSMDEALIGALRTRGVDVLTAREAEMLGRSDREHLEFAMTDRRVLCTFNVGDFSRLHAEDAERGASHAGIILIPQQRYTVGEQLRRILRLLASKSAESMRDQAEYLSAWSPERRA